MYNHVVNGNLPLTLQFNHLLRALADGPVYIPGPSAISNTNGYRISDNGIDDLKAIAIIRTSHPENVPT